LGKGKLTVTTYKAIATLGIWYLFGLGEKAIVFGIYIILLINDLEDI
jgi:hypothetical protein